MYRFLSRARKPLLPVIFIGVMAGCAVPVPSDDPEVRDTSPPACTPAASSDVLLGNWLAVRSQKGIAGELRTLFTLHADGTMAYTEQLKRPRQPSQGLYETGCWVRQGQALILQTQESNGSPVDLDDPIYTNRYAIISSDENMLRLTTPEGTPISAKQMPSGYRLPF